MATGMFLLQCKDTVSCCYCHGAHVNNQILAVSFYELINKYLNVQLHIFDDLFRRVKILPLSENKLKMT